MSMDYPPIVAEWLLSCLPDRDGVCRVHGGPAVEDQCPTATVLQDVRAERISQVEKYGLNDDLLDGTGATVEWLSPIAAYPAALVEEMFRQNYVHHERSQPVTWMHLVREEIAEAFLESDPSRLEEELLQVAALSVSWLEKLRARRA